MTDDPEQPSNVVSLVFGTQTTAFELRVQLVEERRRARYYRIWAWVWFIAAITQNLLWWNREAEKRVEELKAEEIGELKRALGLKDEADE